MKKVKFMTMALVALFAVSFFSACNNDDGYRIGDIYPEALVTVKPYPDAAGCFLQLDRTTTLYPVNIKGLPYGPAPVRALINYLAVDEDPKDCDRAVKVVKMMEILTKQPVQHGSMTQQDLGNDPLEIVKDWVTLVEDGFLTLRFRTLSGGMGATHYINLVSGVNPDNPYEVHLRHNANGDVSGSETDGLVAFDLSSLPASINPEQTIKLVWNSYSGEKSVEFPLYGYLTSNFTPVEMSVAPSVLKME
jgi:hypothetical protein